MAEPDADRQAVEERRGTAAFATAVRVRRNAVIGFSLGVIFALAVFVQFVYLADRPYPIAYWLALAFVLAVAAGLLLTIALTLVSAYRLIREL